MSIAVLCVGNELLMDEGAGPACGRYLEARYQLPEDVHVLDRAVMGMAIISDLRAHDMALVIDALDVPGAEPGDLFSFAPQDAATSGQISSLHEIRFSDVLATAELAGISSQGYCLGVQALNISPSEFVRALTPRVAAAIPLLAAEAARWLRAQTGEPLADRLAQGDPFRAGQATPVAGARDFSEREVAPAIIAVPVTAPAGTTAAPVTAPAPADAAGVPDATQGWVEGPLGVPLPVVWGEPDFSIMASYLRRGLQAIGASVSASPDDDTAANEQQVTRASGQEVLISLPLRARGVPVLAEGVAPAQPNDVLDVDGLVARFGLKDLGLDEAGEHRLLSAFVGPQITDYDCDALIGSCLGLLRGEQERA